MRTMSGPLGVSDPVLATTRRSRRHKALMVAGGLPAAGLLAGLSAVFASWWLADRQGMAAQAGFALAFFAGTAALVIVWLLANQVCGRETRTEVTAHEIRTVGGGRVHKRMTLTQATDVTFLPGTQGRGSQYPYPPSDPRVQRWPRSKILITDGARWIEFHDGRGWDDAVRALTGWVRARPELVPDRETAWLLGMPPRDQRATPLG